MHLKRGGREEGCRKGHEKEKELQPCWHEADLSECCPFVAVICHCTLEMLQPHTDEAQPCEKNPTGITTLEPLALPL